MLNALQGRGLSWGWWSQSIRSACGLSEARECCGFTLPSAVRTLEGHQPGGVEQERVQVLCMDGPMKRWLRAAPLDFWQQVLNLLNGYQDLMREKTNIKATFNMRFTRDDHPRAT